ncbi:MAG: hypothetical protein BGO67_04215 [Alphaproteobacteria bacterium 41-28]|nr:MAG: hypothetical protein BGO67_04215 [Alphaproteobacteria bacterium 41-28]
MVEYQSPQKLDLIFHALADSTRREILDLIAKRTYTVTELAKPFDMSLAAISKHLNVMEKAGLLRRIKKGRICYCSLDSRPLSEAAQLINQLQTFWEQKLTSLDQLLEQAIPEFSQPQTRNEKMKISPLIIKKKLTAPRDKVFEALSRPEIINLWLKPDEAWKVTSKNTFEPGGHFELNMTDQDGIAHNHMGEYKEIIPLKKIVFTWNSKLIKNTLVTIELADIDGFTELTLTHDLFPDEEIKERHHQGWKGCLENLSHLLSKSSNN